MGRDNDFIVKGYPQFVVGTKFGNIYETSYRYYRNHGLPPEQQWPVKSDTLDSNGNPYEFANLEYVSQIKGVGLPAFTNSLPEINVTLDMDEHNVVGAERDVMLESWFYDTSANASIIGNNAVTNQPIAGTLNNMVGSGHRHFSELNNVLLEMMVHVGPLSPNDVSKAKNNPGKHQLTENYSGKDSDGDGIDDHFDVDSHTTNADPGLYSSGIDLNQDGIDDADILPVVIGDYAYSIWYGTTHIAPLVIFSRETSSSLTNDFDPAIPDMDLTTEGEITLPWNDFLNYTMSSVENHLQSAGVYWASGTDNVFPKITSPGGAIGAVEFGVEPQINDSNDSTYSAVINTFDVIVDGKHLGLNADIGCDSLLASGATDFTEYGLSLIHI